MSGDFHTHTWLTDGRHIEKEVVEKAFGTFGLDWMANFEHGGAYGTDPQGKPWDPAAVKLLGDPIKDKEGKVLAQMWRWQSLVEYSWPFLFDPSTGLAARWPKQRLIQGVEWNVPGHEHASDKDTSREKQLPKANADHFAAVYTARYLHVAYPHAAGTTACSIVTRRTRSSTRPRPRGRAPTAARTS